MRGSSRGRAVIIRRHHETGELEFFHTEQVGEDHGEFMTTADVLNLLDISETTLHRRVRKGVLTPSHAIRRGSVIANFYRRDDVLRLRDGPAERE